MKKLACLLFVLVAGCNWQPVQELAISPELTVDEQGIAIAAAEAWFEAVPEARVPVFIGEDRGRGAIVPSDDCEENWGSAHLNPRAPATARVCSGMHTVAFRRVVLHELGHVLALSDGHLPDGNIMATSVPNAAMHLTENDEAYVRDRLP